jgi:hypothetical protein
MLIEFLLSSSVLIGFKIKLEDSWIDKIQGKSFPSPIASLFKVENG